MTKSKWTATINFCVSDRKNKSSAADASSHKEETDEVGSVIKLCRFVGSSREHNQFDQVINLQTSKHKQRKKEAQEANRQKRQTNQETVSQRDYSLWEVFLFSTFPLKKWERDNLGELGHCDDIDQHQKKVLFFIEMVAKHRPTKADGVQAKNA